MRNPEILSSEIIARSESNNWIDAKEEWELESIYKDASASGVCLCTKPNIMEICVIVNTVNGNRTEVGNCCVKKFLELTSPVLFKGINRIRGDLYASMGEGLLLMAEENDWVNQWESRFYYDTLTTRQNSLSSRQLLSRRNINKKVLRRVGL